MIHKYSFNFLSKSTLCLGDGNLSTSERLNYLPLTKKRKTQLSMNTQLRLKSCFFYNLYSSIYNRDKTKQPPHPPPTIHSDENILIKLKAPKSPQTFVLKISCANQYMTRRTSQAKASGSGISVCFFLPTTVL